MHARNAGATSERDGLPSARIAKVICYPRSTIQKSKVNVIPQVRGQSVNRTTPGASTGRGEVLVHGERATHARKANRIRQRLREERPARYTREGRRRSRDRHLSREEQEEDEIDARSEAGVLFPPTFAIHQAQHHIRQ